MNHRNAKYISKTNIDCEIEHPVYGWIPYSLDPKDTDNTINNKELLAAIKASGGAVAYVPPTTEELSTKLAGEIRGQRDSLLSAVDTVAGNTLRWGSLKVSARGAWGAYRIKLLDIPQQEGFPASVEWPTKPV
jgi:hypothetical protein